MEKFESLSDEALHALADRMGLGIPPDLERVFVVEEILVALEEDSDERRSGGVASLRIEETKFSSSDPVDMDFGRDGPPAISPSTCDTFIRVLVRDPSWAFAFWEISDTERASIASADGRLSLFLRVSETTDGEKADAKRDFFDIPISEDDSQWYLNLPRPKSRYRIELCSRIDGRVRMLAKSRDLAVPRQLLDSLSSKLETDAAELLRLSGLESLDIEPVSDDNPQRIIKAGLTGE